MRVIHIITRLIVGGAQENTIASVLGLRDHFGWESELISGPTDGPEGSLEHLLAGQAGLLTVVPELVRPIQPWADLKAYRHLVRQLRARHAHIVHTHSGKAGVLGRLAARRAGVPVVIHTIHGPSFGAFQNPLANAVFRSAEKMVAPYTTHFVVVAQAMADQYLKAGIGRADQYTRIFSGFALEPFLEARRDPELRAQLGIRASDLVIGKIARLFALKGHDDLFEIAPALIRQAPNVKFLLVGDGPWRGRLEAIVAQRGLAAHVIFAGLVAPSEMPRYVAVMDILAHLSTREGLPRALPQALAAARPVVAYDCDGAREVCLDHETGFLVRPGDREVLEDRLLRLIRNPDLRQSLGRRGQELVQQCFPVEKMVAELHALYLHLIRS